MNEETLKMIRGRLDDTLFEAAWESGVTLRPDEAVAIALGPAEKGPEDESTS